MRIKMTPKNSRQRGSIKTAPDPLSPHTLLFAFRLFFQHVSDNFTMAELVPAKVPASPPAGQDEIILAAPVTEDDGDSAYGGDDKYLTILTPLLTFTPANSPAQPKFHGVDLLQHL
jgi:hypothetical protein